jgi:Uma2 family endonuclease
MSAPLSKPPREATYQDLLALPSNLVGELVAGELVASPRPRSRHARTASHLTGQIMGPFDAGRGGPGGWWILLEPELHLRRDVLVPDLAGWRRERLPDFPDTPAFTLAPDWVCEVLSPSSARLDRVQKVALYARERVSHYWLLHPVERTLQVLRLDGDSYRIAASFDGDQKVRAEPFEAIELDLSLLWMPGEEPQGP